MAGTGKSVPQAQLTKLKRSRLRAEKTKKAGLATAEARKRSQDPRERRTGAELARRRSDALTRVQATGRRRLSEGADTPQRQAAARNEASEARKQLAATAEILKVIRSSPTDAQPVFEMIARTALKLCRVRSATVFATDGATIRIAALAIATAAGADGIRASYPRPIGRDNGASRAVLTRHVIAIRDVLKDPEYGMKPAAVAGGFRSVLAVPLLDKGSAIGAIGVGRSKPGPWPEKQIKLLQSFADQAVIAIENARLFNELQTRNKSLTESLEQQTATAEILRVISSSPTDVQPIFDAIVRNAVRLCNGVMSCVFRLDSEQIHFVAHQGFTAEGLEVYRRTYPLAPAEDKLLGRALVERTVVNVADVLNEYRDPIGRAELGHRSVLAVPMLREGEAIGVIATSRREPGLFSESQVELLKTFADQAVIAIENVRLFNETKEALERQTATAEILKEIARSPTDAQPVFDTIAAAARRLLGGHSALVTRAVDGAIHLVAMTTTESAGEEAQRTMFPVSLAHSNLGVAKAARSGKVYAVRDIEVEYSGEALEAARARGYRSALAVPMLRDGRVIGTVSVTRRDPGLFTGHQIELLKTFADQAVIAIEDVRLFNELQEKNRALTEAHAVATEALEQQIATSEILRVISTSLTNVQPVFEAIARNARKLCNSDSASVLSFDGTLIRLEAMDNTTAEGAEALRRAYPNSLTRGTASGRAILTGHPIHISDVLEDPEYELAGLKGAGLRSILCVPMLRRGTAIGTIVAQTWATPRPFTEAQTALLRTFADQAVIAIENSRLFKELQDKNRALTQAHGRVTEALQQQTAMSEILRVISGSPTNLQPVFEAIVESAGRLCGAETAAVYRFEGGTASFVAGYGFQLETIEAYRKKFPIRLEATDHLRRVADGSVLNIPDIQKDPHTTSSSGDLFRSRGVRSIVFVPLIREGGTIGAINASHRDVAAFSAERVELLKTFADQAVIAIENARLFNETQEALERQTATAEILKVIASSPSEVQPVFDAIVQSAARLFGRRAILRLVEPSGLRRRAITEPVAAETQPAEVVPIDRASLPGSVVLEGRAMQIADTRGPDAPPYARAHAHKWNYRANAGAPLVRKGTVLGAVFVTSPTPGSLSDKQMALLQTFADQAVIAIENVRLFNELQSRTEALSSSVRQLTALGDVSQAINSTLDLERVLQTIVQRALQISGLDGGAIYEYDEQAEVFRLRATENLPEGMLKVLRDTPIGKGDGLVGRTVITREPSEIPEMRDEGYQSTRREFLLRAGYRALLVVPMLREDHVIGALSVSRKSPGEFAPEVVELLKTFATQSAVAIQNARLFREIAEKSQQLEVASQHKSQFLASMSHELRTPLNAILGFNEMILDEIYGEVSADVRSALEEMQQSGRHLLRLINNVLDLAKIEAGRMELALSDYSAYDIIENVRATLRPLAESKDLELGTSVPADLPLAFGDPGRLTQCLMNLAGNSLKFTKEGRVDIAVELKGDGVLVYRVADTGIGIPEDKIGSLFSEFKQTDATIASEYGGTGLGLSITKKFVEMHDGRIWVESDPGRGSTFIFEIPLRANTT